MQQFRDLGQPPLGDFLSVFPFILKHSNRTGVGAVPDVTKQTNIWVYWSIKSPKLSNISECPLTKVLPPPLLWPPPPSPVRSGAA